MLALALILPVLAGSDLELPLEGQVEVHVERDQAEWFSVSLERACRLIVWAEADGVDPALALIDRSDVAVFEDDNGGGGTTAFLNPVLGTGSKLRLRVSLKPGEQGDVTIHCATAHETEEVLAAIAEVHLIRAEMDELEAQGEYEFAIELIGAAMDILEQAPGGERSQEMALAWTELAEYYAFRLGSNGLAERGFRHYREFCERFFPPSELFLQYARENHALGLHAVGRGEEARELMERALECILPLLPPSNQEILVFRANLARVTFQLGDLDGARAVLEPGLLAAEELPPSHADAAQLRLVYAAVLQESGDAAVALPILRGLLDSTDAPGLDAKSLGEARTQLATCLTLLGDAEAALVIHRRGIAEALKIFPPEHAYVVTSRLNYAAALGQLGLNGQSVDEYEALLAVLEDSRNDYAQVPLLRMGYAVRLAAVGRRDESMQIIAALVREGAKLPDAHLMAWKPRMHQSSWEARHGDLEQAAATQAELREHVGRVRGKNIEYLRLTLSLAGSHLCLSDRATYKTRSLEAADWLVEDLERWSLSLSPRALEERAAEMREHAGVLLSLAAGARFGDPDPGLLQKSFNVMETLRGAALRGARLARSVASHPRSEALRADARRAGRILARAVAAQTSLDDVSRAREGVDRASRELLTMLGDTASLGRRATASAVAEVLGEGEVVVSFVRHLLSDYSDGRPFSQRGETWISAFVIEAGDPQPDFHLLARADDVDAAVLRWRSAIMTQGRPSPRGIETLSPEASSTGSEEWQAGVALRTMVMDPWLNGLSGVRRIFVIPDDPLQLAPLDALPSGEGDRLADHHGLHLRSTAWELVQPAAPRVSKGPLIAFGGVDYASAQPPAEVRNGEGASVRGQVDTRLEQAASAGSFRSVLDRRARGAVFQPLPGTRAEVQGLRALFEERGEERAVVRVGPEADRTELERLAPQARWLHVASHGWYTETNRDERSALSPLSQCGLALAGANADADGLGRVHGVLTGEELALLDLSACELAVLSACETGLGMSRSGQGCASLQLALHMAGARSALTSLWEVPDEPTARLMTEFYRRVWFEGESKHTALLEAKRSLREAVGDRGRPLYTVADWAAWVLSGESG